MGSRSEITDINQYRLQRRRVGSVRWVLVLVFLLACSFSGYFFARSDFFAVREIEVVGNSAVSDERLIELAGVSVGENIFSFSKEHSSQWLLIEPRVSSGTISRRLPGRVVITVEERRAAAVLNVGLAMVEIDATGRVLERYLLSQQLELPLISGVDLHYCGTVPGSFIDADGIAAALAILRSLPADAENIGEIDVSNEQFICLYTADGTEIRLGDSADFAEKYLVYSNILRDMHEKKTGSVEYIDVSIYLDPVIKSL